MFTLPLCQRARDCTGYQGVNFPSWRSLREANDAMRCDATRHVMKVRKRGRRNYRYSSYRRMLRVFQQWLWLAGGAVVRQFPPNDPQSESLGTSSASYAVKECELLRRLRIAHPRLFRSSVSSVGSFLQQSFMEEKRREEKTANFNDSESHCCLGAFAGSGYWRSGARE